MKAIFQKITIILFTIIMLNFIGCHSTQENKNIEPNQAEVQKIQDNIQQVKTAIQSTQLPANIQEGPVPPDNKNIMMFYYVQKGESLSQISKKIYGSQSRWQELATLNHLKNPHLIYAGDVLHYELAQPSKAFAQAYENATRNKIIVKRGDTLSHLSQVVFGHSTNWRILWKENPSISDPDKLQVGQQVYYRSPSVKQTQNLFTQPKKFSKYIFAASTSEEICCFSSSKFENLFSPRMNFFK